MVGVAGKKERGQIQGINKAHPGGPSPLGADVPQVVVQDVVPAKVFRAGKEGEKIPEGGGAKLLSILPRSELKRIDDKYLDEYYGKF